MVRFFFFFWVAFGLTAPLFGNNLRNATFKMEFNKSEIYVGEQVLCHFNVYSNEDVVEVEVAKFPEFRGFWNENLTLRQGPLSSLGSYDTTQKMANVGTYLLTPMLGQSNPTIEPMKISLRPASYRTVEGTSPPQFIFSQMVPLKIKPLPTVPPEFDKDSFTGAVGKFEFVSPDTIEITFEPNEPTWLQISLRGYGNFAEINRLPIKFPDFVEVVSTRSNTIGGGQSGVKTFDFSLVVHGTENFKLNSTTFVYFDPERRKYESLRLAEINFKKNVIALDAAKNTNSRGLALEIPLQTRFTARSNQQSYWSLLALNTIGLGFALWLLLIKKKNRIDIVADTIEKALFNAPLTLEERAAHIREENPSSMLVYLDAFRKTSRVPLSKDQLAFQDALRQTIEMRYQEKAPITPAKIPSKSELLKLFPPDSSLG